MRRQRETGGGVSENDNDRIRNSRQVPQARIRSCRGRTPSKEDSLGVKDFLHSPLVVAASREFSVSAS